MRKTTLLYLSLAVFLAFVAVPTHAQGRKLRVGISSALTGNAATFGIDQKNGILFALDELLPGGYEAIVEDDRCDPKLSASAAQKFASVDRVDMVFGSPCSGGVLAQAPILKRARIPMMVTSASAKSVNHAGPEVFRTFPSDNNAAALLAKHLASAPQPVMLVSEETEYTTNIAEDFRKSFTAPLIEESFPSTGSDPLQIALRIKTKNPKTLILNPQVESGYDALLKALKKLNIRANNYGFYYPSSPALLSVAAAELEGTEYVDTPAFDDIATPEGKELFRRFKERFGEIRSIELVFGSTFEGVRVMLAAAKVGGNFRDSIIGKKFSGVFGDYTFDENGQIVGVSFVVKRIRNGKPEQIRE